MIEVRTNHLGCELVHYLSEYTGGDKDVPAVGDGFKEGHGFRHTIDGLVLVQLLIV